VNRIVTVITALLCTVTVSGCSHAAAHSAYVSRPVPNSHVLLVPDLQGGRAGWCLATGYQTRTEGSGGCGEVTTTSTGPILAEEGCDESETGIHLYALTTSEVAAVSVYGGRPIPTTTNATLPDGLRAAAVEVLRHNGHPSIGPDCPQMTPLDAHGKPIRDAGKWTTQLRFAYRLPGTKDWDRGVPGEHPGWNSRPEAHGACELRATQLPRETSARWGSVATVIRPETGLVGQALMSCVDITYFYRAEYALTAAVLLNASHPGITPPPLPAMKPLAGHPGIFEAPDSNEMAARRIPGAWLVVEEEDRIGLRVPVELLEDLRATMRLQGTPSVASRCGRQVNGIAAARTLEWRVGTVQQGPPA
jgi:hypothetical protein